MTAVFSAARWVVRHRIFAVCVPVLSILSTVAFSGSESVHESRVSAKARFLFCYPLTDISGGPFLVKAQAYGTSSMKVYVDARSTLGIPSVSITQVVGVTDEAKCKRASQAVDSANIGQAKRDGLYLVAVGTHYLALPATTNRVIVHLDNLFTVKNLIGQQ